MLTRYLRNPDPLLSPITLSLPFFMALAIRDRQTLLLLRSFKIRSNQIKSEGCAIPNILADCGDKLRTGTLMDNLSPSLPQGQADTTVPSGKAKGKSLQKESEAVLLVRDPCAEEDAATAHRCSTITTQVPPHSPQTFIPLSSILHPALGSYALPLPLDNGVSTEQVLGKGDVNTPLAFPSSTCFCKQAVSQKSCSFCSCTKDALQTSLLL